MLDLSNEKYEKWFQEAKKNSCRKIAKVNKL